jgi:hypothetical protein
MDLSRCYRPCRNNAGNGALARSPCTGADELCARIDEWRTASHMCNLVEMKLILARRAAGSCT